jgi:hypothetical protein
MNLRTATVEDIEQIMSLRQEFGHSMIYQMHEHIWESCIDEVTVATDYPESRELQGFYHLIPLDTHDNMERIRCYKQIPDGQLLRGRNRIALEIYPPNIGVIMQGACHRDLFEIFIARYKLEFDELWCYVSEKSGRLEGYKNLGFKFHPDRRFTFFNVNKGARSTYNLGIWERKEVVEC